MPPSLYDPDRTAGRARATLRCAGAALVLAVNLGPTRTFGHARGPVPPSDPAPGSSLSSSSSSTPAPTPGPTLARPSRPEGASASGRASAEGPAPPPSPCSDPAPT